MATMNVFIFPIVLIFVTEISLAKSSRDRNKLPYRVVCYYSSITAMTFKMSPDMLNTIMCTHMIYAFAALENNELRRPRDHPSGSKYSYENFNDISRKRNPNITTLIAVGGWDIEMLQQNTNFSKMAKDPATRLTFVKSVVRFLQKFDFDGFSLDWAYPAHKGKWFSTDDKRNFVTLLRELKTELSSHDFVLSCAAATGRSSDIWAYDIPEITRIVDFVNLLTFDFHGAWETFTAANAPLYAKENETGEAGRLNIDYVIRHWIRQGMNPDQINFGIPFYCRCYLLQDFDKNSGYGAPTNGFPVFNVSQLGFLAHRENEQRFAATKHKRIEWDYDYKVHYTVIGPTQWCSVEDRISICAKVRYMRSFGLHSAMIWSIDLDVTKQSEFQGDEPLLQLYYFYKDMSIERLFLMPKC